MRDMKVPQNVNRLPLLVVVELVLSITLKKHYTKGDLIQVCLFSHTFKKMEQK